MNINAISTNHTFIAESIKRTIKGVQLFYDKDKERAINLMRPLIILGKPGIGKTVAIRELAKHILKIGYKELRLASMSELDLAGLPMVKQNEEDNVDETTYAASKLLPKEKRDGEYGILALDEITSCSRAARAAALQLLDSSRGVGEYKLPDKWICIGLGNDAEDGGIFEGLEGAFLSRCRCVRLEPHYPSWLSWADRHKINPSVPAFLNCYPEMFYVDPLPGDTRICATPRAWEGVSTQLDLAEYLANGRVDYRDTEMFCTCIASDLTPDIAVRFSAFYAYNSEMIDPELILSGKVKLTDANAGAKESIYLTLESTINHIQKRFVNIKTNKVSNEHIVIVVNFVKFIGLLNKSKGAEAAAMGLEQLLIRVPATVNCLLDPSFGKEYPSEYRLLLSSSKKLQNL